MMIKRSWSAAKNWSRKDVTWTAPNKLRRIQRRVLPLLTDPPSLVTKVCPSMLNVEWPTSRVLSNTKIRCVVFSTGQGTAWTYFVVYTFVVQGVLHLNLLSWWYRGVKSLLIFKFSSAETLNLLLQMRFWSFAKSGGWQPISFSMRSSSSSWMQSL